MDEQSWSNGDAAFRSIFINGHPNGSLMVRMANAEEKLAAQNHMLQEIKDGIDKLPKKLLLWLSILAALIVILEFLGPSIQKTLKIAGVPVQTISQDAKIPPVVRSAQ